MLKIFLGFTFFAILPSIFIYFRLNIKDAQKWVKRYFWFPPIFITLGLAYLASLASGKFVNDYESLLGWFVMLYLGLITPRLILSIVLFISLPFYSIYKGLTRPLLIVSAILSFIVEGGLTYGVFIGRNQFEIKNFEYSSTSLPKTFDDYKIVHISDLHIDSWKGNKAALKRFVDLVNQQKPNLIAFTGDLISHRTSELDGFDSILAQLRAPDGVYSILGNHDYGSYYRFWNNKEEEENSFQELLDRQTNMGWILLNNEHRFIYKDNDSIAIIGVENEGEPPFSQHGDLPKAKKGTEDCFQVLLSHNPSHWRREVLPKTNIDLMLAGHTHAMQLELFQRSPAAWVYKEWTGSYYYGNQALYVNIGAGEIGIPFRLGAWPEITIITLKSQPN